MMLDTRVYSQKSTVCVPALIPWKYHLSFSYSSSTSILAVTTFIIIFVLTPWLRNLRSASRVVLPLGWWIVLYMMRVIRIWYVFPPMSCLQIWWSYGVLILPILAHAILSNAQVMEPHAIAYALTNSIAAITSSRSCLPFHLHPFRAIFKLPTWVIERNGGFAMRLA